MTRSLQDKFESLRDLLATHLSEPPAPAERGVLLIYPPAEEAEFRQRFADFLTALEVQNIAHAVIDTSELPFACLDAETLLEDGFRLEAEDPQGLRQYLASELPRLLNSRVQTAADTLPMGAAILLQAPAALFPWVKYADFLAQLPSGFRCRIVVPFPGHEEGAYLHFLDHRDGFNYLARRIN